MAYSALYRKYRPEHFADVLGQDHIVSVLEGALKGDAIAHAYLFCGSRGTGKTSVARVLAREVGTSDKDLYEIDAASNRGIDDIRALREAVNTLPFESRYKVYIIDECHALTKDAFNAFLKTLEEPPEHVIFVLATTEEDKLPETIISRCQRFVFKKPSQSLLKNMTINIAKKEGVSLDPRAADLIALIGDGSFRDTLGTLQKTLAVSKRGEIKVSDIERVVGAPRTSLVNGILSAIDEKNADGGLKAIREAAEAEVDMRVFLSILLQKMRAVLLLRYAKDMEVFLKDEFSEEDFKLLKTFSKNSASGINAEALRIFLRTYRDIGFASVPQLPLELALIELCRKQD